MRVSHIYIIRGRRGEVYVGQRRYPFDESQRYKGSGVIVLAKIRKYGKEYFKKELIIEGEFTKELLSDLERHYIHLYSPPGSKNSLNVAVGGVGGGRPGKTNSRYRKDIDDKELLRLYKSGITVEDLCERYNTTRRTIRARIPDADYRYKLKSIDETEMLRLYTEEKYTIKDLCKKFDLDFMSMSTRLQKYNVERHTHSEILKRKSEKSREIRYRIVNQLSDKEIADYYNHHSKKEVLEYFQLTEDDYQMFRKIRKDLFQTLRSRPGMLRPSEERIKWKAKKTTQRQRVAGRPVAKIDPITGEIVTVYRSITDAEVEYDKRRTGKVVGVCRGVRKLAYNYKWKYITIEEFNSFNKQV